MISVGKLIHSTYEWIGNKVLPPIENLHEYLIKVAKKWS